MFELPATGGVQPYFTFNTAKLLRYVSAWDYFILACEIIFCVFILYYIIEEIFEMFTHKWNYFKNIWNYLDMLVIVVSWAITLL